MAKEVLYLTCVWLEQYVFAISSYVLDFSLASHVAPRYSSKTKWFMVTY